MSKFKQAIKNMQSKREKVANDIAMLLEAQSKANAPVKSGHLRRMTNSEVENKETKSVIFIGTNNVEYAKIVHEGSVAKNIKAQPYIRDAIEKNEKEIKTMIHEGMKVK